MSQLFVYLLIAHVVFGLIGLAGSYATTLAIIKKQVHVIEVTRRAGIAFLGYVLSWVTAGYYYVVFYGSSVKPTIINGTSPWGHLIFMEAKEHVFLMLPVVTFVIWVLLKVKGSDIDANPDLKKQLIILSVITTAVALVVTLSGIIISGTSTKV